MQIHLCGVRGSTPAPGAAFVRYGGHTSCVALAIGTSVPTLLLDAGSGIRRVTELLDEKPFIGTILLTHLHWDHFQGLPFFRAGDHVDAKVRLYLPDQGRGEKAEQVLGRGMSPPQFPISPGELRGDWAFETLSPGLFDVGGCEMLGNAEASGSQNFSVDVREVPHKGGRTYGYRVSDGRSVLAYIPDHCPTVFGPGADGWGEYHSAALELAQGADVLIHDAHLLAEEIPEQASFGHAAADYAVELARRAGVKRVVLFHHAPDRTDNELDRLGSLFEQSQTTVTVAREGMVLEA